MNPLRDAALDIKFGFRMLRKSPSVTAIAMLTLAIGIGVNTAMFSIVDAVLLRPLPYPEAKQLVVLFDFPSKRPDALSGMPYRDFLEYRKDAHAFGAMAGNAFHELTLTGGGEPAVVTTAAITPDIFSVVQAKPLAGRTLLPGDDQADVAMISETLWRDRFASSPALIGRSVTLDMHPFTVVGILPASFHYPDAAPRQDVWIPVRRDPLFGPLTSQNRVRFLQVIARLRPDVSAVKAQAEMNTLAARLEREFPAEDDGFSVRVTPYRQAVVGDVRSALLILLNAVGLLLLMACANVANLLLSKATSRQKEIGVRAALGASRSRIVRQLVIESALLASMGGVVGVLLAYLAVGASRSFVPAGIAGSESIRLDGPVLIFAVALSLVSALVFGLAPALLAAPSRVQSTMVSGGERISQYRGQHLRNGLIIGEIALATVLLIAGVLLLRSFALVTAVDPGFDPQNVTEAEVSLPQFQYSKPEQWAAFSNDLLTRFQEQPGLRDCAIAAPLPMDRQGQAAFEFSVVGHAASSPGKPNVADYATVSPGYFHIMRVPLREGRVFSDADAAASPKVAVISETLARRYFPSENPIGKEMRFGFPPDGNVTRKIVGVVGDVRDVALTEQPGPAMYVPFAQAPLYGGEIVVRSSLSTGSVATAIRREVYSLDRNLPVTNVQSFPDTIGQSLARERFRTSLLGSFSVMALGLAAVGIFGVVSYWAAQRGQEIGIRVALGAQKRDVMWLIIAHGLKLAVAGLGIGVGLALIFTRWITSQLYGVSATDPLTFGAVVFLLLGVAVSACYFPAQRALRLDPAVALRQS